MPLKRSAEFGVIRKRVANHHHLDSWQEGDLHFFVFQLRSAEEATPAAAEVVTANGAPRAPTEAPVAVFAMHPEVREPVSAVVVSPLPGGQEAEIRDLRKPDTAYTVPVSEMAGLTGAAAD